MGLALLAVLVGLAVLVWSADKFVDGAVAIAHHFAWPPLLIGAVIIGFGTSAPELAVSVISAIDGRPALALGNAYGSNIANIALILGLTALMSPIVVHSQLVRKELPLLAGVTAMSVLVIWNLHISRLDATLLLLVLVGVVAWTLRQGARQAHTTSADALAPIEGNTLTTRHAWMWLGIGLMLLIASSRLLVWGAVSIAQAFGVSELVIGLTVVAIGTSLPELASCIAAARKNAHDLVVGNIVGSNLFNTLAVVGLAGVIHPLSFDAIVLHRDVLVMSGLTLVLFVLGRQRNGQAGRIGRPAGAWLVTGFMAYTYWVVASSTAAA